MKFDLEFSVHGSEPEPYRVRLGTEQGRVVADCSCRFGRTLAGKHALCKHRRAVLQGDATPLGLPAAAMSSLTAWLARNQAAVTGLLERPATTRAAAVRRALPQPSAPRLGTAACIDIETTGLSPQTDQITEVAIALFRFDQDTGSVLGIVHLYSSVAEPTVPISPRVSALTAISAQLAQGRVIDWATVKWAMNQAEFLVAHNAEFEKRFLSRIPGLLDGRTLLCSQHLPTWHAPGDRSSVRLEDLAAAHRIPHVPHRAFGDVQATVQLLGATSPITGAPYFALDCEWADTLASELVSLALVPDDPALPEFYAERLILPRSPTPFVAAVVYPLLTRGRAAMSDVDIADGLRSYLASFDDPVVMHDTGVDLMLLQDTLADSRATVPYPRFRTHLIGVPGYVQRIEGIFSRDLALRQQRHHALIDARVAREAFLACVR